MQALKTNNYGAEPLLRSCGISINTNFTQVDGRVLPAPRVFIFSISEQIFLGDLNYYLTFAK